MKFYQCDVCGKRVTDHLKDGWAEVEFSRFSKAGGFGLIQGEVKTLYYCDICMKDLEYTFKSFDERKRERDTYE